MKTSARSNPIKHVNCKTLRLTGPKDVLLMKNVSRKAKLAEKVRKINDNFTEEQAIQIANFLLTLSEVYYENESKSNTKNEAA